MTGDSLTAKVIADLRTRLLDLRNGNKLLSYKHSERARTHVRIVDELPDFLHDCLTNNKQLSFRPLPEPDGILPDEQSDEFLFALEEARRLDKAWSALLNEEEEDVVSDRTMKLDRQIRDRVRAQLGLPAARGGKLVSTADWARLNGVEPSFDLPMASDGDCAEKHADSEIQTLLLPDAMQGKLAGVIDHARTAQQEMGVNLLHMAIGFLEWFETPTAEKSMLAPLLLYPAELDRKPMKGKGQYRYFLRGEQDAVINITLRQRLATDYNLIVPELEEGDTAETYLAKMAKVIEEMPRWRIRRFATLGLFSFSRLVMYNDLDPARWGGEKKLPAAGVLEALFGRREAGSSDAEEYDIEDPDIEAEVPLLIRDADSSQHHAIIDVMRGKNLVIKGPPGTGKSQTIANIIAAALAKQKSVLFVAEKAAALDVVKKRLDEAGLGDFCFELHSTKAIKLQILASLDRRLNLATPASAPAADAALTELHALRDRLAGYAATMKTAFSALEIYDRGRPRQATIYDILWAEQRTRSIPPRFIGLERTFLPNAMETTRFDADRRRSLLIAIERLTVEFIESWGSIGGHPWQFVTRPDIQVLDVPDIVDAASKATAYLGELYARITEMKETVGETPLPDSLGDIANVAEFLAGIPAPEVSTDDRLLKMVLASDTMTSELRRIIEIIDEHRRQTAACAERMTNIDGRHSIKIEDLKVAAEQARKAGLSDLTLSEISAKVEKSRQELAKWGSLVGFAAKILELFAFRDLPMSPRNLRRVIDAIDILSSIERHALLSRLPSVLDEMVHPILDKSRRRIVALRNQEAVMRERFVIDASISIVEIRRHAAVLKTTGFFGKLSGEFKTARKTCAALLKGGETVADRHLADMLIELADHLEERHSFVNDTTLRTICAHRFYGLDTDIDSLLAASKLAIEIRSRFAGMGEPERSLRRFLLEADLETIDGIQAMASDPRLADLRKAVNGIEDQDADLHEVSARLDSLAAHGHAAHSAFIGMGFRGDTTPLRAVELSEILDRIRELDIMLADCGPRLIEGGAWKGPETDTAPLQAVLEFAATLNAIDIPKQIIELLVVSNEPVAEILRKIRGAASSVHKATTSAMVATRAVLDRAVPNADIDSEMACLSALEPISTLIDRFNLAASNKDELMRWVTLRRGISDARSDGLADLLDAYNEAKEPYIELAASYDRMLYRSLARRVMELNPDLSGASTLSLGEIRTRFRDLDQRIMEMRLQALIANLAKAPIPQGIQSPRKGECTEATLVRNEIAKKKKHIPIRDLVERASNAIRAMKPCTMMSPPSVAQYLKPGQSFDIVIIDEASQMRPEEAICAMARARQAVIVGDPQQLPPSSFFDRQDSDDGDDDEEFEKVVHESILDVARTAFQPPRELLWHYRSRHGSLIAFSNRHFYDDRLIVFPSPQEGHPDYGVRLTPVEGKYRASVNIPEVQTVALAAAAFMAEHPDKSLGIVALNQPQRDMILAEMDRIFVRDSIAERYRATWHNTLEPFFVKNLENVQGDERDVIFISTVYGPDERGNLMQRFGPINGAAGDRRLNVLFSRAKHGVTVFSSMRPDQIRTDAGSHRGTQLLKDYLQFAASGRLDSGHVPFKECDSDFEKFVKERLEAKGYEVVAQVGVAGFWIDLGVRHPDWPYGFLLGIECDGAAYHSSLSARDRDRLRQQILEGLGWTIYRVWSTDWFRDQNRELAKMMSFIESTLAERLAQQRDAEAKQAAFVQAAAQDEDVDEEPEDDSWEIPLESDDAGNSENEEPKDVSGQTDATEFAPAESNVRPIQGRLDIDAPVLGTYHEASFDDLGLRLNKDRFFDVDYEPTLAKLIERCVAVEGPMREDVLARRIGNAHGFHKAGSRIREHVAAIARSFYKPTKEGDETFFWPKGAGPDTWTTFRKSKSEPRPIDEISLQELRILALLALNDRRNGGEDILVVMSRIAGLQRLRAPSRERLSQAHKRALLTSRVAAPMAKTSNA